MPIQYITTKSIFSVPRKSVLVVSVDCSGSTFRGPATTIQAQLLEQFARVCETYGSHCQSHLLSQLMGTSLLIQEQNYWIALLFTHNTRDNVDPDAVVHATRTAIIDLIRKLHSHSFISTLIPGDEYFPTLHLEKLNSDIIHWKYTESALATVPFNFHVYNF
jgi:hypothetical protein